MTVFHQQIVQSNICLNQDLFIFNVWIHDFHSNIISLICILKKKKKITIIIIYKEKKYYSDYNYIYICSTKFSWTQRMIVVYQIHNL